MDPNEVASLIEEFESLSPANDDIAPHPIEPAAAPLPVMPAAEPLPDVPAAEPLPVVPTAASVTEPMEPEVSRPPSPAPSPVSQRVHVGTGPIPYGGSASTPPIRLMPSYCDRVVANGTSSASATPAAAAATEPAPVPAPYTGAELVEALAQVSAHRYPRVRCGLIPLEEFGPQRAWDFSMPTLVLDAPSGWFPNEICTDTETILKRLRDMSPDGTFLQKAQSEQVVNIVLGQLGRPGLVLAGGSLCRAVLGKSLRESDLDVFIVGLNEVEAKEKVEKFLASINEYCVRVGAPICLYRTRNCFTLVAAGVTIQIILRLYNTIAEIVYGFDFGASALVYDGATIWGTELARAAFTARVLILDASIIRVTYERRLKKYMTEMGFMMVLPDLDVAKVAVSQESWIEMPSLAFTTYSPYYRSAVMRKYTSEVRARFKHNIANLVTCDAVEMRNRARGDDASIPIEKDCGYADASSVDYSDTSYIDSFNLRQIRRGRESYLVVKPDFDNPWVETVTIPRRSLDREIYALTARLQYGNFSITPALLRRVPSDLLMELVREYSEIANAEISKRSDVYAKGKRAAKKCAKAVVALTAPDFDKAYPQPFAWMLIKSREDILGLGPVRVATAADWYGEYCSSSAAGYIAPEPASELASEPVPAPEPTSAAPAADAAADATLVPPMVMSDEELVAAITATK